MGRHNSITWGRVAASLAAITALAACGGDDDDAADAGLEASAEEAAAGGDAELTMDDSAPAATGAPADGGGVVNASGRTDIDLGSIGLDVIVEMHVVVASDDIQRSVSAITAEAASLGGGIASSDVDFGTADPADEPSGHAVLVVKVPPSAVNRLIDGLDATGDVRSIDQSAQDVTDQLVDLEVRIANARTSVDHVRAFMDRTQNLSELVSLEAELTRRQTALEQLEAQQRNLEDRVAFATVTVEVLPTPLAPEPVVDDDDTSIGEAFDDGIEAFLAVLFAIAFVLAAGAPFLLLGLVIAIVVWRVGRNRERAPRPSARFGARHAEPLVDEPVNEPEPATASQRE